jgi:SAM-dependent methyltransferase
MTTTTGPAAAYSPNAGFWVAIIRDNRDRYRTELTNAAMLDAVGDVASADVLDAGCGEGYMSRLLAGRGARPIGVDICPELVQAAREQASADGLDIAYEVADVAALSLADETVDLVVANHLLNDLQDPEPDVAELARVLRPGGRLAAILLHPCFYGVRGVISESDPAGYFRARPIEQHFLVDGLCSPAPAVSWARPLQDHIRILTDAGLVITGMSEPRPTDEQLAENPWWRANFRYPLFLLVQASKTAR